MALMGRTAMAMLAMTMLAACGPTGPGVDERADGAGESSLASGAGPAAGSEEGADPAAATPSQPVAGSNAPPGFVERRGEGETYHAAMTHGDGSAEPLLLAAPPVPDGWQVVEADGPRFVETVCGVQLDPVQPRDAAHRRWGKPEDFTYLTSEVHLFDEAQAQGLAGQVGAAVAGCPGYGLEADGTEVPLGSGEHQVTVETLSGLPDGWVGWSETTEGSGMTRLNALRDVDGGWHWVSVVGYLGAAPDTAVLSAAITAP